MSKKPFALRTPFAYANRARGPFITNMFGRYFHYLNKHLKTPCEPARHISEGPLFTLHNISSVPSISQTELPTPTSTNRSVSSSSISRGRSSITNLSIIRKKLHSRHGSYNR